MQSGRPVRYYLDEHVDPAIAAYLHAHGIDVLTAVDAGRANRRIPDVEQLDFAAQTGCVLVSRDTDFLNPREVPQLLTGAYGGIVPLRRLASIGNHARFLRYLAATETLESLAGQIRYYEPAPRGLFPDD